MENIIEKEVEVTDSENWFKEYLQPKEGTNYPPAFDMKLAEGRKTRTEKIEFQSNGKLIPKTRFGAAIVFTILWNGEQRSWYIKPNQYSLLNVIAPLRAKNELIGKSAIVERSGKEKETRWNLVFK